MTDFRGPSPVRSTEVPRVEHYSKYKPQLRIDFHERCGYCGDHDFFRETYYEIDHFIPQNFLKTISPTEYSNLVYSCRLCNNHKRKKWPTGDENVHNDGTQGFIDPCDLLYPAQFERLTDGSIYAKTPLGSWMWSALNLGHPAHRLKWKIEKLKVLLDELGAIKMDSVKELQAYKKLSATYLALEEQLKGKPNFD